MTFRMIAQLWNTNTPAIVSCDADLTENYMYISMKFRTGVHVFCWEVGVFNRSCFKSVSCKSVLLTECQYFFQFSSDQHIWPFNIRGLQQSCTEINTPASSIRKPIKYSNISKYGTIIIIIWVKTSVRLFLENVCCCDNCGSYFTFNGQEKLLPDLGIKPETFHEFTYTWNTVLSEPLPEWFPALEIATINGINQSLNSPYGKHHHADYRT